MAQVINTNYLSLVTQNNLNRSQSALGNAIQRLSSGLRINSAKANLSIPSVVASVFFRATLICSLSCAPTCKFNVLSSLNTFTPLN